jgi:hypothetical protein
VRSPHKTVMAQMAASGGGWRQSAVGRKGGPSGQENDVSACERFRAERRLGEMMRDQPKAKNNIEYRWQDTGIPETPVLPVTLAEAGIDKNLAKRHVPNRRGPR